jgi:hypothetical protein
MEEKLMAVQRQISEVTHRSLFLIIFIIVCVLFFIILPDYKKNYIPIFIKLLISIIIGIIVYTSYENINDVIEYLDTDLKVNEEFSSIKTQINYNYILNFTLSVFLLYLIYTCI